MPPPDTQKGNKTARQLSILGLSTVLMMGVANAAPDAPVVLNPLDANEGYMFDWIFFAIMIPILALLLWDMLRSRRRSL